MNAMFDDLTFFLMANRSMDYLSRRQTVLSENVANANTPNFKEKDLAPLSFKDLLAKPTEPVRAQTSSPLHISPEVAPVRFDEINVQRPDESKPDGNQIQIEDQMQKIGQVKGSYELTVDLVKKLGGMLKTALDTNAPSV
jgi:flagellar basal-body rod protein FlgB